MWRRTSNEAKGRGLAVMEPYMRSGQLVVHSEPNI